MSHACQRIRVIECWIVNSVITSTIHHAIPRLRQMGPRAMSLNKKEAQATRSLVHIISMMYIFIYFPLSLQIYVYTCTIYVVGAYLAYPLDPLLNLALYSSEEAQKSFGRNLIHICFKLKVI